MGSPIDAGVKKLRWNGSDGTCEALGSELGRTDVSSGSELEVSDELGEQLLGSTSLWELVTPVVVSRREERNS
jgi:hypothetical protein